MSAWNVSRPGIFTLLLVTLLIVEVRSFPAAGRLDSSALETASQDDRSVEPGSSATSNTTDDSTALTAPAQQPLKIVSGEEPLPQPLKFDYYDYLQLPNDPDDELPALPDHSVNVNEDYAGIYDYRGSQDGRFRRKRTLTTNVEQFLTRSSRTRSKRSAMRNAYDENTVAVSPAEQAENLVSLLSVMQDSDPEFDAKEFLKVLDAPSVSEQDLEYLLLLSNLASQKEAVIPKEFPALPAPSRSHNQKSERKPFYLSPDLLLDDALTDQGSWLEDSEQARISQKNNFPRTYPISSLLSAREPSAGIAM